MLAGVKYGFANQKSGIFNGREVKLLRVYTVSLIIISHLPTSSGALLNGMITFWQVASISGVMK